MSNKPTNHEYTSFFAENDFLEDDFDVDFVYETVENVLKTDIPSDKKQTVDNTSDCASTSKTLPKNQPDNLCNVVSTSNKVIENTTVSQIKKRHNEDEFIETNKKIKWFDNVKFEDIIDEDSGVYKIIDKKITYIENVETYHVIVFKRGYKVYVFTCDNNLFQGLNLNEYYHIKTHNIRESNGTFCTKITNIEHTTDPSNSTINISPVELEADDTVLHTALMEIVYDQCYVIKESDHYAYKLYADSNINVNGVQQKFRISISNLNSTNVKSFVDLCGSKDITSEFFDKIKLHRYMLIENFLIRQNGLINNLMLYHIVCQNEITKMKFLQYNDLQNYRHLMKDTRLIDQNDIVKCLSDAYPITVFVSSNIPVFEENKIVICTANNTLIRVTVSNVYWSNVDIFKLHRILSALDNKNVKYICQMINNEYILFGMNCDDGRFSYTCFD
ncbi:hypothetical protein [Neodiprion sertifer nucleopolyhedrovirus]|uniref:Uncharacterized protein n=1 Tax=Neodiprion sertifer nucleopolyhedrovirus TaxID=111874 RepID=Q6JKB8_9CBAC|nr:hypothetical protein NeseNPV_gp42 [Neodiprion sertifer nucleopolyhedrovirus]AAQ96419.1 hypothetical protein [Neodiprion sertifer nucleopolyhedrovirus]